MPFCVNCGSKLTSNMRFCGSCGYPVDNGTFNNNVKATSNNQSSSKLENCKYCGAPINSFLALCPSCGREINDKAASTACQELCNKLDSVELTRPKEGFLKKIMDQVSDSSNEIDSTDKKKIEIISNFIIPNTKADLLNFLFLAESRISTCKKLSDDAHDAKTHIVQEKFADVWEAKLDEAVRMGNVILKGDADFASFERIYITKKYMREGLCQYCGGKFKGFFTSVCSVCGKKKDY